LPEQQTAQQASSPHKAQGVVNTNNGQGESAPSQVNYADFMKELEGLQNQIASDDDAEADAMRAKIAALQKQVANRATKQQLGKKISDLQQQLDSGSGAAEDAEEPDGDEDGTTNENLVDTSDDGAVSSKTSHKATGKGMIGTDAERNQPGMAGETTMSVFGNIDWFKDVAKATAKLKGMR